jgi:hypothetical protein
MRISAEADPATPPLLFTPSHFNITRGKNL